MHERLAVGRGDKGIADELRPALWVIHRAAPAAGVFGQRQTLAAFAETPPPRLPWRDDRRGPRK